MSSQHYGEVNPEQVMLFLLSRFQLFSDILSCFAIVGQNKPKSLKVGFHSQFTRANRTKSWISQPICKFSGSCIIDWSTTFELEDLHSTIRMFDCMRTMFKKLLLYLAIYAIFGPIWVRNDPDIFCVVASHRSKAWAIHRKKSRSRFDKGNFRLTPFGTVKKLLVLIGC